MAQSGFPNDTRKCPECGERMRYNQATRSYLHVLRVPATCPRASTGVRP
jgi:hypothetical protein